MAEGTRPSDAAVTKGGWTNQTLAAAIGVNERTIRNWRKGDTLPADLIALERALFGNDPAKAERLALRQTLHRETAAPEPVQPVPDRGHFDPPPRCRGRDTETADLIAALTGDKDATIVVLGPGGIGKTTVTQQVLASEPIQKRFQSRRWFVPLDTVPDAAGLRTAIVVALGLDPADPHAFDRALAMLGEAPGLLVLDNLETPWEGDMRPTQDTLHRLSTIPGLSLMASLRGAEPPSSPAFTHFPTLGPLPDADARALFVDFAPKHAQDPLLDAFMNELDGNPLAIELIARRATVQPDLRRLWAQWQTSGPTPARHRDLPEGRLTSLVRSIGLSWQSTRLSEPARRLFRLLGTSPAGLAEEDQEALLGEDALDAAEDVLRVGLAYTRDNRLDLRPPVRGFARVWAPLAPEEEDRWCRYFLALTKKQGERVGKKGGVKAAARLVPELPNLEAAFATALAEPRRPAAVAAAQGYGEMLRFSGYGRTATLTALAAACHESGNERGEAISRFSLGTIAVARSDPSMAIMHFDVALQLFDRAGDLLRAADCVQCFGDIALRRSDHIVARIHFAKALKMFREIRAISGEANCLQGLGEIALHRFDQDRARTCFEEALPLHRSVGGILGEASCIRFLGDIAMYQSNHIAARALYDQVLLLYREIGDITGEATCTARTGEIMLNAGEHDAAQPQYENALSLFQRAGNAEGEGNCLLGLGRVAQARMDYAAAQVHYRAAMALYQSAHAIQHIAITHMDLASVTVGAERDAHVQAARAAWLSMNLPDQAERVTRRFG